MAHRQPTLLALLLATVVWPTRGQEPASSAVERGSAEISGSVADHDSGAALSGALVVLRLEDGSGTLSHLTDRQGTFRFSPVRATRYLMRVTHLGYKPASVDFLLDEGDALRVDVEMVSTAVELEPVVATATRRTFLHRTGFHDRRSTRPGRFMTRSDIEEAGLFRVSELFRRIPGFSVETEGGVGRDRVLGRGRCPPTLFVDGVRTVGGLPIDEVLRPEDLEGLEIYHASESPVQFQGGRCGTVVAWTRSPEPSASDRPFSWRRVFVAAGFVGLALWATGF